MRDYSYKTAQSKTENKQTASRLAAATKRSITDIIFTYYIIYSIMTDSKKQKIINDIYFDKAGFGSLKTTLEDSKKKDSSITMDDVRQFFRNNVEIKAKQRWYNSFTAPKNNHTYQIDLFFIGYYDFDEEQKFRGGLVCIDVLSKYAVVVPIKTKKW